MLLEDNTIIICENDYKNKILKDMTEKKLFLNVKFFSKKEFFSKYLFSYDEKTIAYLVSKYKMKVSVAKNYLNNLVFIEDKEYSAPKLKKLKDLKKELEANKLLIYNNSFKKSIENYNIYINTYPKFFSYEEKIIKDLNIKKIEPSSKYEIEKVYEFNTIEDEVEYVFNQIAGLLKNGEDINNIKLTNVSNNYYNLFQRYSMLYNIPIKLQYDNCLYAKKEAKTFLDNFDLGIKQAIESIKGDATVINSIIKICNKYSFGTNIKKYKELIIDDLKSTSLSGEILKNGIEIVPIDYPFEEEIVFLMSFNTGDIPKYESDEAYITDNIKTEVNEKSTFDINNEIYDYTVNRITSIKNLTITYKLASTQGPAYPSPLIDQLSLKVENNVETSSRRFSIVNEKLKYAKMLNDYFKYGHVSPGLSTYQNTFSEFGYMNYNNKYQNIGSGNLKTYLKNNLTLSYSTLNTYNKCAFRYYLSSILRIDKYEDKFEAFLGSIYHSVLEKCFNNELDVHNAIEDYIKNSNRQISAKEKFFIKKIEKDIIYSLDVLKKQLDYTTFDKFLFEKNIVVDKSNDIKVDFTGYIDKIMYKEEKNHTYASIIDYKTGYVDLELKYLPYGLSMQLPIYLYLITKAELFNNLRFAGFYLQYILPKDGTALTAKTLDEQKQDNLKLIGYSINDQDILEKFDSNYYDSNLIKSMKTKADGTFSNYAKVLSQEQMDNIVKITEDKIDEAIRNILDGAFDINPKKIAGENIGCDYCKFKDICFKKEEDSVDLEEIDDLSFLGGAF